MQRRFMTLPAGLVATIIIAAAALANAQAPDSTAKSYAQPKTPWGEPDLQGIWGGRHQTTTPFERPKEYAGREFLTDEEIAAKQKAEDDLQAQKDALTQRGEGPELGLQGTPAPKDVAITGYEYNTFWVDTGHAARVFRRTSLIVGPEGTVPYRPEVAKRIAFSAAVVSSRPPEDFVNTSWHDRDMGERCITDGNLGMVWGGTGPTRVTQGPGYIVIEGEQFRDLRLIPTDGRPHGTIRSTLGESVGRWDGNTLVVETKNFDDKSQNFPRDRIAQEYRTPTATMHLLERFTRVADDGIDYEVTVTDPSQFTKPFTVAFPWLKSPTEQIFLEYACHEGNYGMLHLLSQARNLEKKKTPAGRKP